MYIKFGWGDGYEEKQTQKKKVSINAGYNTDWGVCPYCGSDNITAKKCLGVGGYPWVSYICGKCHKGMGGHLDEEYIANSDVWSTESMLADRARRRGGR